MESEFLNIRPHNTFLPALNACLNALSLLFLILGFVFVKQRKLDLHKIAMSAAFGVSAAFLASYLYYHFNYEAQKFGGVGWIRPVYFFILISHIILAVAILPFIFRVLYFAWKGSFEKHARTARWVWPAWIYTSLTGVLVYLMLYQGLGTRQSIDIPEQAPQSEAENIEEHLSK